VGRGHAASGGDPGLSNVTDCITDRSEELPPVIGDPNAERILGGDGSINQRKRVEAQILSEAFAPATSTRSTLATSSSILAKAVFMWFCCLDPPLQLSPANIGSSTTSRRRDPCASLARSTGQLRWRSRSAHCYGRNHSVLAQKSFGNAT
jgi:hypothetical protein